MQHIIRYLLVACLSISATALYAKQISVKEAKQSAISFFRNAKADRRAKFGARLTPDMLSTVTLKKDARCFIFNVKDGGFVIIADDDDAPSCVLGYSDKGFFDETQIPLGLQDWLNDVSYAMNHLQRGGEKKSDKGTTIVEPLIKTTWSQGTYYNDLCPVVNGEHCVTGCVATAMAQIMKYWEWPKQGRGSQTYFDASGCKQDISVDFSQSYYDWDNMLDNYYEAEAPTSGQINAVATLMRDAGASVTMYYTPTSSGSSTTWCANAFKVFFSYNSSVIYLDRTNFDYGSWTSIMRNELDCRRPILYSGTNSQNGGHAYVCDGYDDAELFHINWGWGGLADGWFQIMDMNGFDNNQGMVIGIEPDYNATPDSQPDFSWTFDQATSTLTISGTGTMPYTYSDVPWKEYMNSITNVVIEEGVTNVSDQLFMNYNFLENVTLPEGLTAIGYYAFGYTNIKEITLPSSLLSIGGYAFCNTTPEKVTIPKNVLSIETGAFCECRNLQDINVEEGSWAFTSVDGVLYNRDVTTLIQLPGARASYSAPESVSLFASYSMCGNPFETFTVPEGTKLGNNVFEDCSSLKSLFLPKDLTTIPRGLCIYDSKLTECPLNEGLTSIDSYAFMLCDIKELDIPATVNEFNAYAFAYNYNLNTIRCHTTIAPKLANDVFSNLPENGKLCVPEGSDYSSWLAELPEGWEITYGEETDTTVTPTPPSIYPKELYVLGNDGVWNPASPSAILPAVNDNGLYSATLYFADANENMAYFCIGKEKASSWEEFNSHRLGAQYADYFLAAGNSAPLFELFDTSFMVYSGTHIVTVDLPNKTVYLDVVEVGIDKAETTESNRIISVTSVSGMPVSSTSKGIVIVRYADGKTKKVIR